MEWGVLERWMAIQRTSPGKNTYVIRAVVLCHLGYRTDVKTVGMKHAPKKQAEKKRERKDRTETKESRTFYTQSAK